MKSPFNKKAKKPTHNCKLQPWQSGEFLALELLSFWVSWRIQKQLSLSLSLSLLAEAVGSIRVVSWFRWADVLCSLRRWVCCVGGAQIGGGAVLLWPRSVVVLCCCEAQINGSHTSFYLTLTLFLSLRLIWKFLAQDFCGFDVKALLVVGKFWKI